MDITEKERIDDQGNKPKGGLSTEQFCIVYAVCHVMGMLSACANPVIYGYLNENFNREFKEIFISISNCFKCCSVLGFRRKQREEVGHDEQEAPPLQNQLNGCVQTEGGGGVKVKGAGVANHGNGRSNNNEFEEGGIEMQPMGEKVKDEPEDGPNVGGAEEQEALLKTG